MFRALLLVSLLLLVAGPAMSQDESGSLATPGRYAISITHDGTERAVLVQTPDGFDVSASAPLVIALHGAGDSAQGFIDAHAELLTETNRRGWLLALPEGTACLDGVGRCWAARPGTPNVALAEADDVGFLQTLIAGFQAQLGVDPGRVFVTGFSNGADMAQRFAAEAPSSVRAMASVAGTVGRTQGRTDYDYAMTPTPQGGVPVMLVKGLKDETILFYGGVRPEGTYQVLAASYDASFWAEGNGCSLDLAETRGSNTDPFHIISYRAGCRDNAIVNLIGVRDMTHDWPDADDQVGFDATRAVLDYFAFFVPQR